MVAPCSALTENGTDIVKSPRQPVPHDAVVKLTAISLPLASRMRAFTVASNRWAVPEIVTGLDTRLAMSGPCTRIAGSSRVKSARDTAPSCPTNCTFVMVGYWVSVYTICAFARSGEAGGEPAGYFKSTV